MSDGEPPRSSVVVDGLLVLVILAALGVWAASGDMIEIERSHPPEGDDSGFILFWLRAWQIAAVLAALFLVLRRPVKRWIFERRHR